MDIEKQLIDLETKMAFQEDTIIKLHDALFAQQKEIFRLTERVDTLEQEKKNGDGDFGRLYLNEKPPHY